MLETALPNQEGFLFNNNRGRYYFKVPMREKNRFTKLTTQTPLSKQDESRRDICISIVCDIDAKSPALFPETINTVFK